MEKRNKNRANNTPIFGLTHSMIFKINLKTCKLLIIIML